MISDNFFKFNISPIIIIILWIGTSINMFFIPNVLSLFLIVFLVLFSAKYVYSYFDCNFKIDFKTIYVLVLAIMFLYVFFVVLYYIYYKPIPTDKGFRSVAYLEKIDHYNRPPKYELLFTYFDENGVKNKINIVRTKPVDKQKYYIITVIDKLGYLTITNPSKKDLEKYKFPVSIVDEDYELGNDSYEYAKYERDIAYNNFGLNIVQIANTLSDDAISFVKLNGMSEAIKHKTKGADTFLVYSNINPKFFDGWHVCPESLCTSENFSKIEEGGYGYIFRGKIYSKEETEKYWNIIEQYKLREAGK